MIINYDFTFVLFFHDTNTCRVVFILFQEFLSVSPANSMVTRFLEEESFWSKEMMQKLDSHIQSMKEDNVRTVFKYLPGGPGLKPAQASVQNSQ